MDIKTFHLVQTFTIFKFFPDISFQNNPKDLDLSYKTDLDLWDCFGRVKLLLQQNFIGLV